MSFGPRLDRRAALGLIGAGALAGCGAGSRAAVSGGRLRAALPASSTADTLDPARQATAIDYCRGASFYNGLTGFTPTAEAQMLLAEAMETRDAITWTVKLRPNVRFHDGKPLTPADVIYSLHRHSDPAVGSQGKAFAGQFATIQPFGVDAVRITLSGPNADLPLLLATPYFHIVREGTTDFRRANGTGAFRCVEFTPGIRSIGIRNDDYWRGPPKVGEVEIFSISDESARLNALLAGDVDIINSINQRMARRIRGQGFGVLESAGGGYTNLIMRVNEAPGNDPAFVEGMKHLLDRETMRDAIFRGFARIGNDHPIPPGHPFFDPSIPQRTFDPDRAKSLFRKAGLTGSTIPIVSSTAAEKSDDMAVLMQSAAAKAGIHLDIRRVPADGYWSTSWMKVPVGFGNINSRPSADVVFTQFFMSDAPWNESGWTNERFDRLLLEARGVTDVPLRKQLYGQMQRIVRDKCGIGIPLFLSTLDAYGPRVKGLRAMPNGGMMGYGFAEHVWLEDAT